MKLDSYVRDFSYDEFLANSMMKFACIKQIEIIGEAATRISDEAKAKNTHIEWRQISGIRNIIVHQYFGVDFQLIWQIIEGDLPVLKKQMNSLVNKLD